MKMYHYAPSKADFYRACRKAEKRLKCGMRVIVRGETREQDRLGTFQLLRLLYPNPMAVVDLDSGEQVEVPSANARKINEKTGKVW